MTQTLSGKTVLRRTANREYEDYRSQAFELAEGLTPEWTDFYPFDVGVVIVEAFAGHSDILSYYIDRGLNEAHWDTCQLRQSIINQASLIGYTLSPPSSSTVNVDVIVDGAVNLWGIDQQSNPPFQIKTVLDSSSESYTFELLESVSIGGAGTTSLVFTEGRTVIEENVGTSNGNPSQSFSLSSSPVTSNSLGTPSVQVKIGAVEWLQVTNFTESEPTDPHFTVSLDSSNVAAITFGDGANGSIPTAVSPILVTYRTGGGSASNSIGVGTITEVNTQVAVDVTVTNTSQPTGGQDAETVEEAREQAPKVWATQDRAVTHADYEALARTVNGVWKAKAEWYKGSPLQEAVYVASNGTNPVPSGTWDPVKQAGTGLLGIVGDVLVEKKCSAVSLYLFPVTALTVELDMEVVSKPNYYNEDVKARVKEAVSAYILGTGGEGIPDLLPLSGLMAVVEDVDGVDYADVNKFYRHPYIETMQVGIADSALSSVTARGNLVEQLWTIRFLDQTTFTVEGSVSGVQRTDTGAVRTGTSGVEFTTDTGTLTFTISAGTYANKAGDTYTILTSDRAGNVPVQDKEVPILPNQTVVVTGGIS